MTGRSDDEVRINKRGGKLVRKGRKGGVTDV